MSDLRRCCGTPPGDQHTPWCALPVSEAGPAPGIPDPPAVQLPPPTVSGWDRLLNPQGASVMATLISLVKCPLCRALVEDRDSLTHQLACK